MRHLITKPIVLVGMMGTGKSTVGKKLARKLNFQFYDSDQVIEQKEGLSVVDIFDYRGEDYFREQEARTVSEVISYGKVVLSTGGGTFIEDELRSLIKSQAISIWLSTDFDTLYERVARRNTRPLLNVENKKEVLEQLIKERYPIYEEADIHVESKNMDAHFVVDTIMLRLEKYIKQNSEAVSS